jgi:cell division protein ZapA (FtsZ GTPase activity inhibitor)
VNSSLQARQPVALEIAGQRLRLYANADEAHLRTLAGQVNERCDAIQSATRNGAPSTLLALAALDLADELAIARRKLDEVHEQARAAIAASEARASAVEQLARGAVADAIGEIDRTLLAVGQLGRKQGESESA